MLAALAVSADFWPRATRDGGTCCSGLLQNRFRAVGMVFLVLYTDRGSGK